MKAKSATAAASTKSATAASAKAAKAKKAASVKAASVKPASVKAAKGERPVDPAIECRKGLYDAYRAACAEKVKAGKPCGIIERCGKWGVGTPEWPVEVFKVSDEAFKALGPAKVRAGRDCITRAMYGDPEFTAALEKQCGAIPASKRPHALSVESRRVSSVTRAMAAAAAAAPPAPAAGGAGKRKRKVTRKTRKAKC